MQDLCVAKPFLNNSMDAGIYILKPKIMKRMIEANKVQVGDWVGIPGLFPGLWRVYRVLIGFKEFEWNPTMPIYKPNQTFVFCHRLVNNEWKRSFSHQSCNLSLVQPLAKDEIDRVKTFLSADKKLQKAFEQYQAKQSRIDSIANIGFGGLSKEEVKSFPAQCSSMLAGRIQNGMTLLEIMEFLKVSSLDQHRHELPQQVTLQLTCVNHELRGEEFLFREYRTLNF
jgi:hypothetical protein